MNSLKRIETICKHLQPLVHNKCDNISLENVCGIIAYIGNDAAAKYLHEGLSILQNRGYDSAGITTISKNGELVTTKYASKGTTSDAIDKLMDTLNYHEKNTIGIAHTRWATHGPKTDYNAHPHHDQSNRIALVHNGIIENSNELKEELIQHGVHFRSETDTEVIVQLIGFYLNTENCDIMTAVRKALSRLLGTWGVVILDKNNPNELIAAKNGSPLLIGQGQNQMFIASESSAFNHYTKEYISLENGEIVVVKANSHSLDQSRVEHAPAENIKLTPDPYPHWTIKEILEQPEAISRSLNYGGRFIDELTVKLGGLEEQKNVLKSIKHLIISACGTSLYAAHYGAGLMRSFQCFESVQVVDAAELGHEHFTNNNGSNGLLVLSQSGETKDVHRVLIMAEELNIPIFSVVNIVGSLIARTTKCGVYLNAGREMAVASTKAFTCQVTVLALITVWFTQIKNIDSQEQKRRNMINSLHRLSTNVGMILNKIGKKCRQVALKLENADHCFILGKGLSYSIAMEGSLKIKEISYLHAEGYSGGALKHGPFALIDQEVSTPVILIILDDIHFQFMCTAAAEVKTRGAHVIVITDVINLKSDIADDIIYISNNGMLTSLLAIIPLQLIAYELAVIKKINPDKPRNLAKAVTVD
jgi:glucosamine--fructose-6-phosphate aminotransferase (isomerizing)